jgi:hypothetical protein
MNKRSTHRRTFADHKLREVHEGQILKLAGTRYAVMATQRRRRMIHVDLEAEDGDPATLIGLPDARVKLHEGTDQGPLKAPVGGERDPSTRPAP